MSEPLQESSCVDARYSVVVTDCGHDRLRMMSEIRQLRPELLPKAVKSLIDRGEVVVAENLNWWDAKSLMARLRRLDATVEIRDWRNEFVYEYYMKT